MLTVLIVLYSSIVTGLCIWLAFQRAAWRYHWNDAAEANRILRSMFAELLTTEKMMETSNPSPALQGELSRIHTKVIFATGRELSTTASEARDLLWALKQVRRQLSAEMKLEAQARQSIQLVADDLNSLQITF